MPVGGILFFHFCMAIMLMKITYIAALLFYFAADCFAQHENILISNQNSPNEPCIIINPLNTDHMVIAANLNNLYISTDGGHNWESRTMTSQYGVWGDPCVVVDTNGSYYFFHLSNFAGGSWIDRIVCQKAESISAEWSEGNYTFFEEGKKQDKEWAVVDRETNNIYIVWTQFDNYGTNDPEDSTIILFAKSTDAGDSWTGVKRINEISGDCLDQDNSVMGAVPAMGPEGEIYAIWSGPAGLVFDKSTDQGDTWLENDILISDIPDGHFVNVPGIYRTYNLPTIACDLSSGENRGHIHACWADQRNGEENTDIWFSKSTDGGLNWQGIKMVNDDESQKHQFFPWMTIDRATGYIYIVFYDRRNYEDNNTDIYLAWSADGGETFKNVMISESPFNPAASIFFGDYTNVSAYNNIVRPVWTRLDTTKLSLWTAIIDMEALCAEDENIIDKDDIVLYPNPFYESAFISFKLRQASTVSLSIYDNLGKKIEQIYDNQILPPGKYSEQFSSETILPGVYYFHLQIGSRQYQRRIIYVY